MFSKELKLEKREDGKYELRWKVSEGFYQTIILTTTELEKIISEYRVVK